MLNTPPSRVLRKHLCYEFSCRQARVKSPPLRNEQTQSRHTPIWTPLPIWKQTFSSLGQISFPLATPPGVKLILVDFDIVEADVLVMLGMDVLYREQLVADTVSRRLARRFAHELHDGRQTCVYK